MIANSVFRVEREGLYLRKRGADYFTRRTRCQQNKLAISCNFYVLSLRCLNCSVDRGLWCFCSGGTKIRLRVVGVTVRREKALDFSGCNSRPGTGSLHPVAIETAAEATKLSELSMERVARRPRERAGHNVSER